MKKKRTTIFFRRNLTALFVMMLSFTSLAAVDYPKEVLAAKRSITGRMMVSHIGFLASPHCRGRLPGDVGMEVADMYITSVLKGIGVSSAGSFGSYFQPVPLKTIDLCDSVYLNFEKRGLIQKARLELDYLPIYLSAERESFAPLVFAGYGITAQEYKYDDYKNINVKGKIVLVMRHEPGENDKKSPFEGRKNSKYGTFLTKIINAQKHGAIGILFVTDPLNHQDQSLSSGFMSGTSWASLRKKKAKNHEDFKYFNFQPRWIIEGDDFGVKIPVMQISGQLADSILGVKRSLKKIQEKIDKTFKPNSFNLSGKKIAMAVHYKTNIIKAHNIVFKVEGSDSKLKDEVIIIGAHYDHLGKDNRGQVYGGADDNASGTAAVIELARAFQNLKQKPKRTILFMLFTAEEKGLLGSRYYSNNPIFPLKKTIAMFNLDMIGRNNVDQLNVLGKYQYPKLFKIVNDVNKKTVNIEFNFSVESSVRNSDQFPFMRNNVPILFFISGLHDQYHTPRDTPGRLVTEKIEKVSQLVFLSLWETANLPAGTDLRK